jgi:hypothetical protein
MWTCQMSRENTVSTRLSTAIAESLEGLKYELDSQNIRFLAELTDLLVAVNLLFTSESAWYLVLQQPTRLETYNSIVNQLNNYVNYSSTFQPCPARRSETRPDEKNPFRWASIKFLPDQPQL